MNKCPFHTQKAVAAPADWWPDQLNFSALHKEPPGSKTVSKSYAEELAKLDLLALKADLMQLMTTSQEWYYFVIIYSLGGFSTQSLCVIE